MRRIKRIITIFIAIVLLLGVLNIIYKFELKEPISSVIVDKSGNIIFGVKNQIYKSLSEFPEDLKNNIISIEDKTYYRNIGIAPLSIARAVIHDIKTFSFSQGGSTISQQVIKLSQSAYNRSFLQKINEIFLAVNINTHYSKDNILLYYINNIDFLNGIKGFKSACNIYFAKDCKDLFDSEKLFLIAVYQTGKNPLNKQNFKLLKNRTSYICPTVYSGSTCSNIADLPPVSLDKINFFVGDFIPHIVNYFKNTNEDASFFDVSKYNKIEKIIENTKNYRLNQGIVDCCIVVMNSKKQLISMNVCRDWKDKSSGKVNGCLMNRQTGSTSKPFLYMLGMSNFNLNEDSIIKDEPVKYVLEGELDYTPQNFDLEYHGNVTIAQALGSSLNIPAIKMIHDVGVQKFVAFLEEIQKSVGIEVIEDSFDVAEKLGLSMALGTYEISPLNFTKMWTVFIDQNNSIYNKHINQIAQIYNILSNNNNRLLSFTPDNVLDIAGWAVKTGTSRHFVDGWTCGINKVKGLVVCVWTGNYNSAPMVSGGVMTAGYLWNLVVNTL